MKLRLEKWYPNLGTFGATDEDGRYHNSIRFVSGALRTHPAPAELEGRHIECVCLSALEELACCARLLPAEDVAAETAAS